MVPFSLNTFHRRLHLPVTTLGGYSADTHSKVLIEHCLRVITECPHQLTSDNGTIVKELDCSSTFIGKSLSKIKEDIAFASFLKSKCRERCSLTSCYFSLNLMFVKVSCVITWMRMLLTKSCTVVLIIYI